MVDGCGERKQTNVQHILSGEDCVRLYDVANKKKNPYSIVYDGNSHTHPIFYPTSIYFRLLCVLC